MPSINLAPGTQYIVEMRKRRQRLLLLSLATIAIIGAVWGGMAWYRQNLRAQEKDLDAQIRNVNMQIAKLEEDAKRILLFENRLVALDNLLNQHVSLDPFLQDLEKLMPADVVLEEVNLDAVRGVLRLSGRTGNIDQIALALASLVEAPNHASIFTSGNLTNVTRDEAPVVEGEPAVVAYEFNVELTFNPTALRKGE
ncbi:MAG: hypothetical protein WD200_05240 [Candidatus Andersenbacteria bacterium]